MIYLLAAYGALCLLGGVGVVLAITLRAYLEHSAFAPPPAKPLWEPPQELIDDLRQSAAAAKAAQQPAPVSPMPPPIPEEATEQHDPDGTTRLECPSCGARAVVVFPARAATSLCRRCGTMQSLARAAAPALLITLALAGCGPTPLEQAEEECEGTPECIDGATCVRSCRTNHLEIAECCECLSELDCLGEGLTENRCNENLQRGGTVSIFNNCDDDPSRCGSVCAMLSPADG